MKTVRLTLPGGPLRVEAHVPSIRRNDISPPARTHHDAIRDRRVAVKVRIAARKARGVAEASV